MSYIDAKFALFIVYDKKVVFNMIKRVFLLFTILLLFIGCGKGSKSSKIEPVTVGGYDYDKISDVLDKKASKSTPEPTSTALALASPSPTSIPYDCKEIEYKTFLAINKIRKENNLNELKWDEDLYDAIIIRSKEISKNFSHTRPDGSSCFTVSKQLHGENIAKGYTSVDRVVEGWMNSPGHRENILRKDFKRTVIGYYKDSSGTYWCQGFGY